MITIYVKGREFFNDDTNEFLYMHDDVLRLEHSLLSVAKWESKWNKPFLSKNEKTEEESLDYIRCMIVNKNVQPEAHRLITNKDIQVISDYISAPMTATTFRNDNRKPADRFIVTSEIIYYQMIQLGIPFECEKWHLNRLLTLIRVCSEKSRPAKKIPRNELASQYKSLNDIRRKALKTKG